MPTNLPLVTYAIIGITVLASLRAFNDAELRYKMLFRPIDIKQKNEWYRFLSGGLIHADFGHLFVNMFVLYSFGSFMESVFQNLFGPFGSLIYLLMYVLAIPASSIYSYFKHHDDYGYSALGASGAVSAVLFSYIAVNPLGEIYLMLVIPIKAIIAGVLYLLYSHFMGKRNMDNVGHDAHFYGAVFGFLFTIAVKPSLLPSFIEILTNWLPL